MCNKSFVLHGNLTRHMITHDPNHPLYQDCVNVEAEEEEEEEEEEDDEDSYDTVMVRYIGVIANLHTVYLIAICTVCKHG